MPFDYLYYKLYRATLKGSLKDIPQYITPIYLGGLISINISVIYIFLVKINTLPYFFANSKQAGWLFGIIIALAMLYYRSNKCKAILNKYSSESEKSRKTGNIIVAIYVAISVLLIFAVAFFKPGYLGK